MVWGGRAHRRRGGLPYHRPPLSKGYLAGKNGLDDLLIRGADFYEKQHIRLLNATVEAIHRSAKRVSLSTGDTLTYTKLALCTGARARRLPTPGWIFPEFTTCVPLQTSS